MSAVDCEEDLKVGFEDDNEKDEEIDECTNPDDNFK